LIETIREMARSEDDEALGAIWAILGAEVTRPRGRDHETHARALGRLLQATYLGKGDIYAAERRALSEFARSLKVDPERHPTVEELEDGLAHELLRRVGDHLRAVGRNHLRGHIAALLKRTTDEERLRLAEQTLADLDRLGSRKQRAFARELAAQLSIDASAVQVALSSGAEESPLPLLVDSVDQPSVYELSTTLLSVAFSAADSGSSFVVDQVRSNSLNWLLGPWAVVLTSAFAGEWRRRERWRKLAQLATFTSFWRHRGAARSPGR
jgi:hypothetical protein